MLAEGNEIVDASNAMVGSWERKESGWHEAGRRGFKFSLKRIGLVTFLPYIDLSSSILTNLNLCAE